MQNRDHDAIDLSRASRSRVGESLRRLQQNIEQTRQTCGKADEQFAAWHDKWSDRRDQITQRLEMIDAQLEQLSRHNRHKPQLSLVGEEG